MSPYEHHLCDDNLDKFFALRETSSRQHGIFHIPPFGAFREA